MATSSRRNQCCGEIDLSQVGNCMHCVVLAAALTAVCWIGFALVTNHGLPWLSGILLVFSCLFSLLLVTHALAALARQKTTAEGSRIAAAAEDAHPPLILETTNFDKKE